MESGLRVPLIILEVAALGAVLALVEQTWARVALGLMLGLLLARNALAGAESSDEGPPPGLPERRQDHLYRHWVNVLTKKIREFHTVCRGVREERVNLAVGRMKVEEIERELQDLLSQVTDLAKPPRMRRRFGRRGEGRKPRARDDSYGQPTNSD